MEEDLTPWTLAELKNLRIDVIADMPSFLFLWAGSSEHLEDARELMKAWNFRRCEDVVWLKTGSNKAWNSGADDMSLFHRTKEHCLVGIRGTVRRGSDGHFIHANVDTDVIVSEEMP